MFVRSCVVWLFWGMLVVSCSTHERSRADVPAMHVMMVHR